MNLRRVSFVAACLSLFAALPAAAQSQPQQLAPWPQQGSPQQPGQWPQQGVQGQQPAPPQQADTCMQDFVKLRDNAQKRAEAIRAASQRKAEPKEACELFNSFSDAEAKMIKYVSDNVTRCGIPKAVETNLKQNHAKTNAIRSKVCQVAASPARSAAPSLSDALSAPVPDSGNIKTGRGTYDTLTGTPLGK
jgi:hypothetical protein